MKIMWVALSLCVVVPSWGDNCYVFDRNTAAGQRSYEDCKDQAADMDRSQARLDRWSDSINSRNAADQDLASNEQSAQKLNALLLQLQQRRQ